MSLLTALYSGATGLESNSTDLSVIGDNIANANTIGFKSSRVAFADAMARTLIGSNANYAAQGGLGTKLQSVQKIMSQGALSSTGLTTDLAVEGNGFFVVRGTRAGTTGNFYTRAGQFTVDKDGYLSNLEGLRVQGYTANSAGTLNTAGVGDLVVGHASAEPRASTTLTVKANLQSDAPAAPGAAFDPADAAGTSNYSTSTTVFDSLGNALPITIYFRKGASDWSYHAVTDGGNLTGGTAGTPTVIADGTMAFDGQGRLTGTTPGVNNFNPAGALNPQPLELDFGTPVPGGSGVDGVTQFAAPFSVSFLNQDGYASGELARISIDSQGKVVGAFTNGTTRVLGQVTLASFEAPDQLMRVGGSLYTEMPGSGGATVGAPATSDRGSVISGALEQSNVDLAGEFIRMIAAQRGFQANSKTLTTADQLLQELMTIKR